MRTTIDLPDELYRRAKAEAAFRGRKFKELVEEGLQRLLSPAPPEQKPAPSLHDLMQDCCGIVSQAPADYASNPEYMDQFGR